jgi:uncharacterized protein YggT (Ycf19 family)
MDLLFQVLNLTITLVIVALFINFILSLADPGAQWAVTRVLNAVSDPYFRRVRGLLPTIGMLDLSGFLIFILAWIVRQLLVMLIY